jgi:UDP-N-acetyl-D-galactosamine dehydrogenase
MIKKGVVINGASLLMLGITFKENCPDVRNTKIVDVIAALEDYGIKVSLYDPWANPAEVLHEYRLKTSKEIPTTSFDALVLGVAHQEFIGLDFNTLRNKNSVLYDVKGVLGEVADGRL